MYFYHVNEGREHCTISMAEVMTALTDTHVQKDYQNTTFGILNEHFIVMM